MNQVEEKAQEAGRRFNEGLTEQQKESLEDEGYTWITEIQRSVLEEAIESMADNVHRGAYLTDEENGRWGCVRVMEYADMWNKYDTLEAAMLDAKDPAADIAAIHLLDTDPPFVKEVLKRGLDVRDAAEAMEFGQGERLLEATSPKRNRTAKKLAGLNDELAALQERYALLQTEAEQMEARLAAASVRDERKEALIARAYDEKGRIVVDRAGAYAVLKDVEEHGVSFIVASPDGEETFDTLAEASEWYSYVYEPVQADPEAEYEIEVHMEIRDSAVPDWTEPVRGEAEAVARMLELKAKEEPAGLLLTTAKGEPVAEYTKEDGWYLNDGVANPYPDPFEYTLSQESIGRIRQNGNETKAAPKNEAMSDKASVRAADWKSRKEKAERAAQRNRAEGLMMSNRADGRSKGNGR